MTHPSSIVHRPSSFLGSWLVSEYVYNPDGSFAGIIHQKRDLEKLSNGHIRVTQHCQPSSNLATHPMGRFIGKPVFDLSVEGRIRHYHGPAVLGTGLTWGDGAMTGRGLWTEFGYNFSSFAVQPNPERQITGGKFFMATEMAANIVGLAMPASANADYPEFIGTQWAGEVAKVWRGECRQCRPDGAVLAEKAVGRIYTDPCRWEEDDSAIELSDERTGYRVTGNYRSNELLGFAKRYGWMLEMELVMTKSNAVVCETQEILENAGKNLIVMRRWYKNQTLETLEIIRLKPVDYE